MKQMKKHFFVFMMNVKKFLIDSNVKIKVFKLVCVIYLFFVYNQKL
jgi:hypothetical protein